MKVKITYFKESGKFYDDAELQTPPEYLWQVTAKIQEMINNGRLPGLSPGGWQGPILIETDDDIIGGKALMNL